jgi:nucleolar protein 6
MGPTKQYHDATRAERKAKKRKLQDAIPDLPEEKGYDLTGVVEIDVAENKKPKKMKGDTGNEGEGEGEGLYNGENKEDKRPIKKDKRERTTQEVADPKAAKTLADQFTEEAPRKSKKERKAERKAKEAAEGLVSATAQEQRMDGPDPMGQTVKGETAAKKNNRNREKQRKGVNKSLLTAEDGKPKTPAKFIVFIGTYPSPISHLHHADTLKVIFPFPQPRRR